MKIEDAAKVKRLVEELDKNNVELVRIDRVKDSVISTVYGVTYDDKTGPLASIDICGCEFRISVDKVVEFLQLVKDRVKKEREELIKELENV